MAYKSLVSPLGTFQSSNKNFEDYVRKYGMSAALEKLHSYLEAGGSKVYVKVWMKQILQIGGLNEDDEDLAIHYYEGVFNFGVPAPMRVGHFICKLVFNIESRTDMQRIREESGIDNPLVLIAHDNKNVVYLNALQQRYVRTYLSGGRLRHLWMPKDDMALDKMLKERYNFFGGVEVNVRKKELLMDEEKFKLNVVSIDELLQTLNKLQKTGDKAR